MNLSEQMSRWGELKLQLNFLEAEIQEQVLQLGKTQEVGNVIAKLSKGNGSYAYRSIANELPVSQETVEAFSEVVVDWKKVAENSGMTDELKEKYYTPPTSQPKVTVQFKK